MFQSNQLRKSVVILLSNQTLASVGPSFFCIVLTLYGISNTRIGVFRPYYALNRGYVKLNAIYMQSVCHISCIQTDEIRYLHAPTADATIDSIWSKMFDCNTCTNTVCPYASSDVQSIVIYIETACRTHHTSMSFRNRNVC